ncbi:MAG: hypothetical protein TREMPRED_005494 [Tremellales sp. Tagirdzhanova-0007]|nr:MAG: hypothetical protein TREMPRED_005494 [Tremellales sp. Tagirdzhanova-0007]
MSSQPLLPNGSRATSTETRRRGLLSIILIPLLLLTGVIFIFVRGEGVPKEDFDLANYYLKSSPVIDGHIDLPEMARVNFRNNISAFDLNKQTIDHLDIPRLRKGHLGGFFWSIYATCPDDSDTSDFVNPTDLVRDTLEQIDVSFNLIEKYSDTFRHCRTADDVMEAIKAGKVAILRMYHQLGVRYMTLTHSCNNAFADSGGIFAPVKPKWGGLSPLGEELVREMNRLGIMIDLSHVSDQTALQALAMTQAPVMLSHSCARHYNDIGRNVPDVVLDRIGRSKGKVDGVVMVNFYPSFAAPAPHYADINTIADHVTYIADRIGKHHVGIGSDYDGIETTPQGLEDVSKYPYLFAELIHRGWSQSDLSLLAGGNILRVMRGMEEVSEKMKQEGTGPSMVIYDKRTDLVSRPAVERMS